MQSFRLLLPTLTNNLHKGQCGRIGIVGGCKEYSGAPYFAGSMAFRMGADLVYVFTADDPSAQAVKAHSPDLIVMPFSVEQFDSTIGKLHSVVVGPGAGTSSTMAQYMEHVILKCIELNKPLVLDADCLALVNQAKVRKAFQQASSTIMLTPNVNECKKLLEGLGVQSIKDACQQLGRSVYISEKGSEDIITHQQDQIKCNFEGAPRRVGGQGDLTAGSLGILLAWVVLHKVNTYKDSDEFTQKVQVWAKDHGINGEAAPFIAAEAASYIVRTVIKAGYSELGRSLLTSDVLQFVATEMSKNEL